MELVGLLERFAADGDEAAMEDFVRRTRRPLLAAARRIAGADAEDAVQTAYHSLLRRAEIPRPSPLAWLTTVVVRNAYRHVARRRRAADLAERLAREAPPERTPADGESVRMEVRRLPAKYRDVVVLHYLEGLTAAETGRLLGLHEAAVRQRLKRARGLLRSRLSPRLMRFVWWLPWVWNEAAAAAAVGGAMKSKTAWVALLLALAFSTTVIVRTTTSRNEPGTKRVARRAADASVTREQAPDAGNQPAPATETAFATGVVTDHTGAPLPDVFVVQSAHREVAVDPDEAPWLSPAEAAQSAADTTDDDGRFRVATPVERIKGLAFVKPGYVAAFVKLTPAGTGEELRVVLRPASVVTGIVLGTDGGPVTARISVWPEGGNAVGQHTQTDGEGRFELSTVAAGGGRVTAAAAGYAPSTALLRGEVEIVLRRNAVILDASDASTGEPIHGGEALLLRDDPRGNVSAAYATATPGRLVLPLRGFRATGPHTVHLFATGYRAEALSVTLGPGHEPPRLAVAMTRGALEPTVTGRVIGGAAATLELRFASPLGYLVNDESLRVVARANAGADGRFSLAVPVARYRLIARAAGAGSVALDIEAPAHDLEVRLAAGCALEVATAPGTWAHVEVDGAPDRYWNAKAGKTGVARFDELPAGRARVGLVRADQSLTTTGMWPRVDPRTRIALVSGGVVRTALTAPVREPFTILVHDSAGRPQPRVALKISCNGGPAMFDSAEFLRLHRLRVATDGHGRALLELLPGRYSLALAAGRATRAMPFVVPTGGGEHRVVLPAAEARLRGRVVDARTGEPLADRRITVSGDGWPMAELLGSAVTDDEGRFEVGGLPGGSLTVHVSSGGAGLGGMGNLGGGGDAEPDPYGSARRPVESREGSATDVVIELPRLRGADAELRPVRASVHLKDATTGAGIEGASVQAWVLRGDTWLECGLARTDAGGLAEKSILAGARYAIQVFAIGYPATFVESTTSEERVRVEVPLTREE